MARTRWAMVGTGLMLELIGHDFARTENVDMRVIVSRTQERADAAAALYGFPEASADFDAVLQRADIDVVYIATPHTLHFPQAMAALEAGKHVLVEKSMTTSAARTRELCAFAAARGLFAMEAMWTAFNPAIVEMRRRIAEGLIGDVQLVQSNFCTAPAYRADWRLWAKDLAGGSTLDQGVYTLSLAHMLLGAPTSIRAHGTVMREVDGEVVATLEYASGQRAVCINGLRAYSPLTAFVAGSTGTIEIPGQFWNPAGFTQTIYDGANATTTDYTYRREGAGYVPMLRAVSEAVLGGAIEHPLRTHADSIAVAESMDAVLQQVLGSQG
ncbi:MAG: Gfo/Idh/MocA family protein [Candidatus Nanopelagicales bacterium]